MNTEEQTRFENGREIPITVLGFPVVLVDALARANLNGKLWITDVDGNEHELGTPGNWRFQKGTYAESAAFFWTRKDGVPTDFATSTVIKQTVIEEHTLLAEHVATMHVIREGSDHDTAN